MRQNKIPNRIREIKGYIHKFKMEKQYHKADRMRYILKAEMKRVKNEKNLV